MEKSMASDRGARATWDESFKEQIADGAYNTAPVEAIVRFVSYYLRERFKGGDLSRLHFLEMGCGAGPNLVWLAGKGIRVSGVDISPTALSLARQKLVDAGCHGRMGELIEGSVTDVPMAGESLDGIVESCVFQHLAKEDRRKAFAEVGRLLKPQGVFVGHMLETGHSTYRKLSNQEQEDDPGTIILSDGSSKYHLTNIGLTHFFTREEVVSLLPGFSLVDPCLATYSLPRHEAAKRGYEEYLQSMWIIYAIK
jgi:SAM-dependent methyltransferase